MLIFIPLTNNSMYLIALFVNIPKILKPREEEGPDRMALFNKYRRERLKIQGRIDLAKQTIERTEKALDNYPRDFEFRRIPMPANSCPTVQELLPTIWEIEKLYRKGKKLYVYSREGHGRCGLICAALLGRLYGLTSYETLYRIQAAHDVMPSEYDKKIRVHCPQLWNQRRLVTEVLDACNRFFQGTIWRTRKNPEIYVEQHHARRRGEKERLVGPMDMSEEVERIQPTILYREALETASESTRANLSSEDSRQRREGHLEADAPSLPPQHHRKGHPFGFSKVPQIEPKMEGELRLVRVKPSKGPKFPLLRTENEAL